VSKNRFGVSSAEFGTIWSCGLRVKTCSTVSHSVVRYTHVLLFYSCKGCNS